MLSTEQITLVKSTIPLLEDTGPQLTEHFYTRMFRDNPELKNVFNLSHQHSGKQPVALFNALAAYAKHLDAPANLESAVVRIAHKHTSFNIQPEHYAIVGHHLIATLEELGGPAFSEDIKTAWAAAYEVLAGLFIETEAKLYSDTLNTQGGWNGPRTFRLVEKRIESELVKSLVFEATDQGDVAPYQPGQYLGIKLEIPNHPNQEIRQYSLSQRPSSKRYQISVKREIEGVPGIVSNYLHDGLRLGEEVELLPPAGDFFFVDRQRPVVLISAGVGLTPMMSILDTLLAELYPHAIHFIHACENAHQHSFKEKLAHAQEQTNCDVDIWYKSGETADEHCHHGLLDLAAIKDRLPLNAADFYLCGPVPFMQFAKQQLTTLGVHAEHIYYEVFGPHETF
jgi:nitric oxide dioxygenase